MAWRDRFGRRDRAADIDAEVESHIRMAIHERIGRGESPADARRRVLVEFGNVRRVKEDARAVWSWTAVEQFGADLRAGARILTRAPGLSATAITLVALVIGGNTTIYSVVHGLLTKPAPSVRADGLVSLGWVAANDIPRSAISYPHFRDLAAEARSLELAAFQVEPFTLVDEDGSYPVRGNSVTGNYFDVLRVPLAKGRAFAPSEDTLGASGLVAVISHRLWQERFGGREDAVGRSVTLDRQPATIIGVAAEGFQGVWLAEATDVWVPLLARARVHGEEAALNDPAAVEIHGTFGRLAEDVRIPEAQAEIAAISLRLQEPRPAGTPRRSPVLFRYTGVAGRDNLLALYGPRFLAIFSIVTLLTLLIVCANVANLMLARAVARQREMAVRQSFGASRSRIVRLLLAEGLTLSLAAWGMACLFAYWMSMALPGIIPASESGGVEVALDFTPDWAVLGYAMLLAVAATVLFTIAPAARTWRQDLLSFLKAGEQGIVQGRSRLSQALVVLQLAFSVLLLTGAGLAWRSLSLMGSLDLGFPTGGMLVFAVDTSVTAKTPEADRALVASIFESLRAVPGLDAVTYARQAPAASWPAVPVKTGPSAPGVVAERNETGPGYFAAMGVPLIAGREFPPAHRLEGTMEAVINQHLAASLWPGGPAIGRTILVGRDNRPAVVRGVAGNALLGGFRRQERPFYVYLSAQQEDRPAGLTAFFVRHTGPLDTVVPAVSRALRAVDVNTPMVYVRTLETDLDAITWGHRTLTVLLMLFAAGSLLIAAIGQYGAMAFALRSRVRDFGIRIAMGASTRQILSPALREGLAMTAAGLTIGLLLGLAAGRTGRGLLYGVTPTDAATYAGVMSILGIASLAACYLPARRAARVDPIQALREE